MRVQKISKGEEEWDGTYPVLMEWLGAPGRGEIVLFTAEECGVHLTGGKAGKYSRNLKEIEKEPEKWRYIPQDEPVVLRNGNEE